MNRVLRGVLKGVAWALVAVAGLVLLALLAAYALVGTERGTGWAADRFIPEEVTVEAVEGRLLGPLTLHGVVVRGDDGALTELDRVHLEWRPGALLATRRARVTELDVVGVRHTAGEEEDPEEVEELEDLPEVRLPVDVEVERARVRDVRIRDADGEETVALDEIRLRAGWSGSELSIGELVVAMEEGSGRLAGSVELAGDYPLDLDLEWEAALPDLPALAGGGTFRGSLADLHVDHRMDRPTEAALTARVRDIVGELTWQAELEVARFDLGAWDEELAGNEAGVTAEASGSLEAVEGRASVVGSAEALEGPGEVEADVAGSYAEDRVALDDLQVRMPDVGGWLAARGEVLLEEPLTVDVTGEWADLSWPPVADPDFASPEGRFAVDGTLEAYTFDAEAAVTGRDVPSGEWRVEGTGTSSDAAVSVVGDVLQGRLLAQGDVAWDPEVAWDVAVDGEGLNPAELHPDAEGVVTFRALSDGRVADDDGGVHADLLLEHLEGDVAEEEFSGRADLGIRGDALDVRDFRLEALDGEWTAVGSVAEEWDMEVRGSAPDLAVLEDVVEGIEGSLEVEGRLEGAREEPRVTAYVDARDVSGFDVAVDRLELRGHVERLGHAPSEVELRVEGLETPEASLAAVELDAGGTREDHRVTLWALGLEGATLDLGLSGGLEGEAFDDWQGALEELAILDWTPRDLGLEVAGLEEVEEAPPAIGRWVLEAPVALHASPEGAGLETACLRDGERAFCVGGEWAAGVGGEARVMASELPLDAASPWLAEFDVEGTLGVDADVALDGDATPVRFAGDVRTSPGSLRYQEEEDAPVISRDFREIRVRAEWLEEVLDAELVLDFVEEGDDLRGTLRVVGADPVDGWEGAELEGELVGSLEDRGLAALFVPALDDSRGALSTDLRVGGTVDDARVSGSLNVDRAGAVVIPAGIEVEDVALEVGSQDGTTWNVTGEAWSGEGHVDLTGSLTLDSDLPGVAADGGGDDGGAPMWSAELTVRGEDFEAFNTADARVVVTPDLEARGDSERIDLGGSVLVPSARITPGDMEGVVRPSPDVVVVGVPEELEEEPAPIDIHTSVRVELGNDVTIDAFGLTGRLAGSLTVEDGPDQVTTGRGELEVLEGEFTMYGQTLAVDRGRLIFADGPVNDPGLDIRVTREVDEVLVGLNVAGTADRPEGEVFSEPAMAEADALSYLILGRPVRTASPEEGDVLADAARSAGLAGAGRLAEQLGVGVLGLEEAYIDPGEGEDLEEAQLVVGVQVTPSIHVGYALGLFEAGNILRIRYDLGRQWTIRTEAGEETSGDLFYTIER